MRSCRTTIIHIKLATQPNGMQAQITVISTLQEERHEFRMHGTNRSES